MKDWNGHGEIWWHVAWPLYWKPRLIRAYRRTESLNDAVIAVMAAFPHDSFANIKLFVRVILRWSGDR